MVLGMGIIVHAVQITTEHEYNYPTTIMHGGVWPFAEWQPRPQMALEANLCITHAPLDARTLQFLKCNVVVFLCPCAQQQFGGKFGYKRSAFWNRSRPRSAA